MYAPNVRRQEYRGWAFSTVGYALFEKKLPFLPDDMGFYRWEKEKHKKRDIPAQIPLQIPLDIPPQQPAKRPSWWGPEEQNDGERGIVIIELSSLDSLLR